MPPKDAPKTQRGRTRDHHRLARQGQIPQPARPRSLRHPPPHQNRIR
jgi:hypothetical protein